MNFKPKLFASLLFIINLGVFFGQHLVIFSKENVKKLFWFAVERGSVDRIPARTGAFSRSAGTPVVYETE